MSLSPILRLGLLPSFVVALSGCESSPSAVPPPPPVVQVSLPVERKVTDYVDFTGRTDAVDSVEIRARVAGYLEKINFQDGVIVKEGAVLFEIDPRPYKAVLDQAVAKVRLNETQLKYQEADYQRNASLYARQAASRDDFEKSMAARDVAQASLLSAKAEVEQRRLDHEFTKVRAPISGRISRKLVTEGNLVLADKTLLTTIVSEDPMYAYFDVDEHTVLRVRQLIREGKAKSARDGKVPVQLGLANEPGYPHDGTINFVDNQVNPKTGTLRIRGVFPNKDGFLLPRFFARLRVPIGEPHKALLVSDRAIDTDQGQKILYAVNNKNEVVSRPIRVGMLHHGLRVIADGLQPGERVIVYGLQQVRPGVTVEPKLVDMPEVGGQRSEVGGQKGQLRLDERKGVGF